MHKLLPASLFLLCAGCQYTFNLAPEAAVNLSRGVMVTSDGQRPLPEELEGRIVWKDAEGETYGTTPTRGGCAVAQRYPEEHVSWYEQRGARFDDVGFSSPGAMRAQPVPPGAPLQKIVVRDDTQGCVVAHVADIQHIEVVDTRARSGTLAALLIPIGVVGAGVAFTAAIFFAARAPE